jgi:tetratricopeptide (TPR) repeat protein
MKRSILFSLIILGFTLLPATLHADSASSIAKLNGDIRTLDDTIQAIPDEKAKGPLYTERAKAFRLRALELEKLNRYEEAINDYIRCFEDTRKLSGSVRNREAELYSRVAFCQLKLNKFSLAKENMNYARKAQGWLPNEPFYLEYSARVHLANEEYDAAIADCISIRSAQNALPLTKQSSYIIEATAIYLHGDYDGAVAKWREMATLNPKFAAYNIFDHLQAPFNKAVAESPNDLDARLKRVRFFRDRANQKRFPNNYPAVTRVNLGGLINLIDPDVTDVQPHSFYQAAHYDLTKAIEIKSEPAFYAERALLAHLWNEVAKPNDRTDTKQIITDINYAIKNHGKNGVTLRAIARYYQDSAPDNIEDPQWRSITRNSIYYYSLALIHDPSSDDDLATLLMRNNQLDFYLTSKPPEPPKVKPTTPLQWKDRGNELTNKKHFSAALDAYDRALKIDPKFADAYNNKGNVYMQAGAYDLALKEFDSAIKADPKHRVAYYNRSILWQNLGDSTKALTDANNAIQFATTLALKTQALNQRAELYFSSQRYPQALNDLKTLITSDPKNSAAWTFRGQTEIILKDLPAAIQSFQKSLEIDATKTRPKLLLITAQHLNGAPVPNRIEGAAEEKQWLHHFLISKQFSAMYINEAELTRTNTLIELIK